MVEPLSIAALVAGGLQVASAVSGIQASRAQASADMQRLGAEQDAANYQAQISRENAAIDLSESRARAEQADRERRIRAGEVRATFGGSGRSYLDLAMDNAAQEELNILTIQQQGLLAERSGLQQAGLYGAQASNAAAQVPGVRSAYRAQTASTILNTGARLYGMSA